MREFTHEQSSTIGRLPIGLHPDSIQLNRVGISFMTKSCILSCMIQPVHLCTMLRDFLALFSFCTINAV